MYSVPKFEIYEDEESPDGVFDWGRNRGDIYNDYHNASELYFSAEIEKAKNKLQKIINKDGWFIDAFNLLSEIERDCGDFDKARDYSREALDKAYQIIPDSFEGQIRWGFTENRPFLRALHARAMDEVMERNYAEGLRLLERTLNYNPSDNQGVRYLIGDLYFLQDNLKEAAKIYQQNLDYPPYLYSYGLLHFTRGDKIKAITCFRKGVMSNIYISDYLRLKLPLINYEIWQQSNFEGPQEAHSYIEIMLDKWRNLPDAIGLLQFLHMVEPSQSEIRDIYALKHELYFADSGFENDEFSDIREDIFKNIETIKNNVTDASSAIILEAWEDVPFDTEFPEP
jgi:tetratricopeptide (TPR) repeat protein